MSSGAQNEKLLQGVALAVIDWIISLDASQRTVLIVENNAVLAVMVRDALAEVGYMALVASNAAEAVDLLAVEPVDLLFTNVQIHEGHDGLELALHVRQTEPSIAILLTTEYAGTRAPEVPFELLPKPYRIKEMIARVGHMFTS